MVVDWTCLETSCPRDERSTNAAGSAWGHFRGGFIRHCKKDKQNLKAKKNLTQLPMS
jgi:hypothetical protein